MTNDLRERLVRLRTLVGTADWATLQLIDGSERRGDNERSFADLRLVLHKIDAILADWLDAARDADEAVHPSHDMGATQRNCILCYECAGSELLRLQCKHRRDTD